MTCFIGQRFPCQRLWNKAPNAKPKIKSEMVAPIATYLYVSESSFDPVDLAAMPKQQFWNTTLMQSNYGRDIF